MAAIAIGLVVAGYGLPELTAGLMKTLSPLDSQEKSVAASAELRTASFISFSSAPFLIPERQTFAGLPCASFFSFMGICDTPKLLVLGQTANTDIPAATFRKFLLFIGLSFSLSLFNPAKFWLLYHGFI